MAGAIHEEADGERNPEEESGTDDECIMPSPVLASGQGAGGPPAIEAPVATTPPEPKANPLGPTAASALEAERCAADYKSMVREGESPVDSDEDINRDLDEGADKGELDSDEAEVERLANTAEVPSVPQPEQTAEKVSSEEQHAAAAMADAFEAASIFVWKLRLFNVARVRDRINVDLLSSSHRYHRNFAKLRRRQHNGWVMHHPKRSCRQDYVATLDDVLRRYRLRFASLQSPSTQSGRMRQGI